MSDGVLFGIVFLGFFVLRGIAATIFFYFLLPDNVRCPMCDAETLHIHSPVWRRTVPGLRPSWCPVCGWEGTLRRPRAPLAAPPSTVQPSDTEREARRTT